MDELNDAQVDERAFRDAMGAFATGVTVITALGPAGYVGVTANSFTSVSLDPPLVLWCLGKSSDRLAAFSQARGFAVSVLAASQEAIAQRFAAEGELSLDETGFEAGAEAAALVRHAVARMVCRREAAHEGGDHIIFTGRVVSVDGPRDGPALTYYRGRYGTARLSRLG